MAKISNILFPSHLLVGDELCADWVVLGLPEDVVEAEDGALPLLEPHVLLRAAQQDLVRRRRRRNILKRKRFISINLMFKKLGLAGFA